ncbi:alpha/beta-hydrolase [Polychaeton citri CBS 116435]|uniref:Alpha/beta-hydrolase n=1 Tax=Polychaeton citri CBS 116435 TaxID=1314669 RepID=A0A9P4QCE4_9PEZI|nr:alpha/beta-hydrolase [Polychaeton citri CBS 116435]
MASHPPAKCCTVGVKHDGEAKGELKDFNGISTYFAYPESKNTEFAVLLLPDVMGHANNAKLIADQFAANGYFTVFPDLFEGDPVPTPRPENFQIGEWLKSHTTAHVDPIIETTIKGIKEELGVKKIAAAGYCFGGKYVARFLAKGRGVDVGYTAHPSFVDVEELQGITGPFSIAAAETDTIFPAEKRRESEDILQRMDVPYQISLYSGVEHGFSVRGDVSKQQVRFAKEAAFLQAVQWFDEYLKAKPDTAS